MRGVNEKNLNKLDQELFQSYKEKGVVGGHRKPPYTLAWNYIGNLLISAESNIVLWGLTSTDLVMINDVKGLDNYITHTSFFNINIFSTMSRDYLKIWDIRENMMKAVRTEKKPKSDFIDFTWNHELNSPQYTILSKDGTIGTYDIRSTSLGETVHTHKSPLELTEIIWDQSDSILIGGGIDSGVGFLTLFDQKLQNLNETYQIHTGKINHMTIDKNNQFLVTCSEDSLVQIHSLYDFICERSYSNTDTGCKKASISGNSQYVAVSCDQPYIHIYNLKKGGHAHKIKTNSSIQDSIAWHPEKLLLAYIDDDEKRKGNPMEESFIKLFTPN